MLVIACQYEMKLLNYVYEASQLFMATQRFVTWQRGGVCKCVVKALTPYCERTQL
jgi:hypothetical protein